MASMPNTFAFLKDNQIPKGCTNEQKPTEKKFLEKGGE